VYVRILAVTYGHALRISCNGWSDLLASHQICNIIAPSDAPPFTCIPLLRVGVFITDPQVMRARKNSPGPKKLVTLCTHVGGTLTSYALNYMRKFIPSLMLWSSTLRRRVVLCTDTYISEENDLSLVKVKVFLRNPRDYTLSQGSGPQF
jgi:hypothetical protein